MSHLMTNEDKVGIDDLSLSRDGEIYAVIPSGHYLEVIDKDNSMTKFVLLYPDRFNEYLLNTNETPPTCP